MNISEHATSSQQELKQKKPSSYQKMKQKYEDKIRELTDDIIILVEDKEFMKVTEVKLRWRTQLESERLVWGCSPIQDLKNLKLK